jgi:hypothetical protein
MTQQFVLTNNVSTTLASPISSGATSLTLTSSADLPTLSAGQIFAITLNDAATQTVFEVIYATTITGATLSGLSRGQEGTTAQSWLAGDYAYGACTAAIFNSFIQSGDEPGSGFVVLSPGSQQSGAINVSGEVECGSVVSSGNVKGATLTFGTNNAELSLSSGHTNITPGSGGQPFTVTNSANTQNNLIVNDTGGAQLTTSDSTTLGAICPAYTASGVTLGTSSHIVFGETSITFSSSTSATEVVTLSGAAEFASDTSYSVSVTMNGDNPAYFVGPVFYTSGSSFTLLAQCTGVTSETIVITWTAIGF